MDHVVELSDAEAFQRCRRAWDLGGAARQNLEPLAPRLPFDVAKAVREGLAAWYFPAMWAWSRSLVRPIALEAFHKAMRAQRASPDPAFPEGDWAAASEAGAAVLERYFDWAPGVDNFTVVRVVPEFDVVVPHPGQAGAGLIAADGGAVRFRGRIDLLVVDEHRRLWLVEHRIGAQGWAHPDALVLDYRSGAACWAIESQYDAKVGGVLMNEVRLDGEFRRTRIRKTPRELRRLRRQFSAAAIDMCNPALPVYPNPVAEHCAACAFLVPCLAMTAGEDPTPVLEASFRRRVPETIAPRPRTGSLGPQRVYGWKTKGPGVKQDY